MIRTYPNPEVHLLMTFSKRLVKHLKTLWQYSTATFERRSVGYSILLHIAFVILLMVLAKFLQDETSIIHLNPAVPVNQNTPIVNAKIISSASLQSEETPPISKPSKTIVKKTADNPIKTATQAKIQAIEKRLNLARDKALKADKVKHTKIKQKEKSSPKTANTDLSQAKRQAALNALKTAAINDLNAARRRANAANLTESALQSYALSYKQRIESVWVTDACREIHGRLPTVLVVPGKPPVISVSSDNSDCDQSLLLAFSNTQAPPLPTNSGARKLINAGIDFQFSDRG